MKRNIFFAFAAVLVLVSCGSDNTDETSESEKLEMMKEEINTLEKESAVYENAADEIESKSNELNELLNEI